MENTNKCPGCSHHCDMNNLQCSKGEAYFRGEAIQPREGQKENRHEHHGEGCGKHRHGCHGEGHGEGRHEHRKDGCCKHRHEHSEEGNGHGHRRPEFPEGSLAGLMAQCGHRLFHGGDETMFSALTDEESAMLKQLLSKLLSK